VFALLTPQNKPHAKNGYAIFGFAHPPPYVEKVLHIDKKKRYVENYG
jgi:hypothetical protein